jgi:hypothetical protein
MDPTKGCALLSGVPKVIAPTGQTATRLRMSVHNRSGAILRIDFLHPKVECRLAGIAAPLVGNLILGRLGAKVKRKLLWAMIAAETGIHGP